MTSPLTDGLAWVVVVTFGVGAVLDATDRRSLARTVTVAAWVVFAGFWLLLVPHFAFEQRSIIEGVLSLAAVPVSLYTGLKLHRGRDSLLVLSRAVAVMGLLYLPANTVEAIRRPLVLTVVGQVEALMHALGYQPTIVEGSRLGYENGFRFVTGGHPYITEVVLACTGLGSISIFAGLVAVADAPIRRKLVAMGVVVPLIYGLNVLRVTFIALAHGNQWFRSQQWVLPLFAVEDPNLASYMLADRVISQGLSVVALVALALVLLRVLPEIVVVFEDLLYLATGDEYDLASAVGAEVRTDGAGTTSAEAPSDVDSADGAPSRGPRSGGGDD